MPAPKDPEKLAAYREKRRQIALEKGFGKWMTDRKIPPEVVEKRRRKLIEIGNDPEERKRRSEQAKANGYGKWMVGRPPRPGMLEYARSRKGKTYEEIYGEAAEEEAKKRRISNRERWEGKPKKADRRPKHNGDYRYAEWRKAVFERDDYTCQRCQKRGGELQAHHLRSWSKHPDLRYDVANGQTLCVTCHKEANQEQRLAESIELEQNKENLE